MSEWGKGGGVVSGKYGEEQIDRNKVGDVLDRHSNGEWWRLIETDRQTDRQTELYLRQDITLAV